MKQNRKFRLGIICPVDFIGGAELFIIDFVNQAIKDYDQNIEIVLFCSNNDHFIQQVDPKVKIIKMDFPRLKTYHPRVLFDFVKTLYLMNKKIDQEMPDILLTNSIRAHLLVSCLAKGKPYLSKNNKKIVITYFVHDFTFPKLLFGYAKRCASKIFTCSKVVKDDLLTKGAQSDKLEIIYNGVDYDSNLQIDKNNRDGLSIGIMGRIDSWKGQDVFIDAAELILRMNPDFHFYIYGKSAEHDRKTVEFEHLLNKKIEQKQIGQAVVMCGFKAKSTIFSEIDILVHASTQKEPFGRVIIEAMGAGVPVIASDLGGAQEIITDGYNGFLISPSNPQLLADKILELVNDRSLRLKMISNGLKTVKEKFNLSLIAQKLILRLEKLVIRD